MYAEERRKNARRRRRSIVRANGSASKQDRYTGRRATEYEVPARAKDGLAAFYFFARAGESGDGFRSRWPTAGRCSRSISPSARWKEVKAPRHMPAWNIAIA
jgi:hypothetical protein